MVKYTVDGVELAWVDMGNKMFNVYLKREDGTKWTRRLWAKDEIDAYNLVMKEQANGKDDN